MQITFDTDLLAEVKEESGNLFLTPEASDKIASFLEFKKQIELFEDEMKEEIKKRASEFDPNFKSITGDKCRVSYREFGTKYTIDPSLTKEMDVSLFDIDVKFKPNSVAIESFVKENGGIPYGVIEKERNKSISITLVK